MQSFSAKTERFYIKILLGVFGSLALIVLLSWGGCQAYKTTQERRLVRRAADYLKSGDLKAAALSTRRAVQINPESADAARMMATIAEKSGGRSRLEWRQKVVQLEPGSSADLIALASSAVQLNEIKIAENALASVKESDRQTSDYHAAAARLAEGQGDMARARHSWMKAVELSPDNKSFQLQWARLRIASGEQEEREAGLALLGALRTDPEQRAAASRLLIVDGIRTGDATKVRAWAQELRDYPEATFRDRALFLEVLRWLKDPQFVSYLTEIENEAVKDPATLGMLLGWMNANAMSLMAIDFAKTLPAALTTKWPVSFELASAHARLADWAEVEAVTTSGSWGKFDFLRRAFLARALRATDRLTAAEQEWAHATKEASKQAEGLLSLAQTAGEWGWGDEFTELLWAVTKFPAKQAEALSALYNHYSKSKDTLGLYRVFLRMVEQRPDDPNLENNLAQSSLLLGIDVGRAAKLAAAAHTKNPKNPVFVSTYAFSLYTMGDATAALQAMNTLSEEQLREPSISAYYGVFLAHAGDQARARTFLDLGEKASLLPEEKALLEQARARLQTR